MKIGILITSISNFGQKGFYNSQEVGLAKAFSEIVEEVKIYKAVPNTEIHAKSSVEGYSNISFEQIPVKNWGINGLLNCKHMSTDIDVLVYFSDTQLALPSVNRWCEKNKITLFPYIGVLESHSTNRAKKLIINLLTNRNIRIYKNKNCFVKTPTIKKELKDFGVHNVTVTPVGLDFSLLQADFQKVNRDQLKEKYGFKKSDKIILFIGRMIDEKKPLEMVRVFKKIVAKNSSYKLLMVGQGVLEEKVQLEIKNYPITLIKQIPNKQIWELYYIAESFVNLNEQEIFGMAILEAMYYGCTVIAWEAPGPKYIIEDNVSGILVNNWDSLMDSILKTKLNGENVQQRITSNFTWSSTARLMKKVIDAHIGESKDR